MSSYSSSSSSSTTSFYLQPESSCSSASSTVSLVCAEGPTKTPSSMKSIPLIYTRRQLLAISPPWSENVRMRLALLDGPAEVISRGPPKEPMAKPIPCPVFLTSRCSRCNDTSAASTDKAALGLVLSRRHTTGSDIDLNRKGGGNVVEDEGEEQRGRGRTSKLRESSRTRGRERSRSRVPRSRRWTTVPERALTLATLASFADRMES